MPQHLFLYGTLRRDGTHPLARRIAREASYLGEAWARGRLYNFGAYPGAVLDEAARERIEGDLYALSERSGLLALLDAYEGCGEAHPLFRRTVYPVSLKGGGQLQALVYVLARESPKRPPIPGGRWRNASRARPSAGAAQS